jgi:hypothetical protein
MPLESSSNRRKPTTNLPRRLVDGYEMRSPMGPTDEVLRISRGPARLVAHGIASVLERL